MKLIRVFFQVFRSQRSAPTDPRGGTESLDHPHPPGAAGHNLQHHQSQDQSQVHKMQRKPFCSPGLTRFKCVHGLMIFLCFFSTCCSVLSPILPWRCHPMQQQLVVLGSQQQQLRSCSSCSHSTSWRQPTAGTP